MPEMTAGQNPSRPVSVFHVLSDVGHGDVQAGPTLTAWRRLRGGPVIGRATT